jgi:hypothetical protein
MSQKYSLLAYCELDFPFVVTYHCGVMTAVAVSLKYTLARTGTF